MKLSEYIYHLGELVVKTELHDNPEVNHVRNNSALVEAGDLFCAIAGSKVDGHRFLPDAVQKGACAVVVSSKFAGMIPDRDKISVITVSDSYFAWGCLCETMHGYPQNGMNIHTVTGTNGKTTIAFLLTHFLRNSLERKCAVSTTVICDDCTPGKEPQISGGTMPDAIQLQSFLCRAKNNGAEDVILESSSHGLHQHRAGRVKFASAVFTNLTGDHLDYHKTMEAYYQAKKSLFCEMMKENAPVVVNTDDVYGQRLYDELKDVPVRRYSLSERENSFCRILSYVLAENGTDICFELDGQKHFLHSPLIGKHNIYNLLSAIACVYAQGAALDKIFDAAKSAPPAPGRLEPFRLPSGAHAFVDYAHTDDALIQVLNCLKQVKKANGKIITVFGCGGDRDRTKRPRMGKAVAENSDVVIITGDNPRSENPNFIIQEIESGIPEGREYRKIPDRACAIAEAVHISNPDDLILIAGKGHENYQEIKGVRHHFDDREQIKQHGGMPIL